jgi:LysM repeat protein
MSSQRRQPSSQATTRRWKSRIQRFLLALLFLQLIIVGAGLYYSDNLNFISPKKNTPLHAVALEKNNPVEEKAAVIPEINKPVVQPQKSATLEDTENSNSTIDAAKKSEKITTEIRFPESHKQVSQDSTAMTDSTYQPQKKPVLSQNRESTTVAKPVTEVISQETSDHYYYTVQAGDNLGLISKEVYGTLTKWRVIANANTDQLENNPNRLRPGMTLVIPPLTETGGILLRPDSSAFLQKID